MRWFSFSNAVAEPCDLPTTLRFRAPLLDPPPWTLEDILNNNLLLQRNYYLFGNGTSNLMQHV